MARITCRTPSTGRPIYAKLNDVPTTFTTVIEPPDFSIPDTSNRFTTRDPLDTSRAIRPGEIFFLTPLAVKNKTSTTRWIEVILLSEDGTTIEIAKVYVPKEDTAFIPLQGRSIFKRNANAANGDRIQIRAETSNTFDIWVSAEEKPSNEHIGVE
jgi:hypothetical protein